MKSTQIVKLELLHLPDPVGHWEAVPRTICNLPTENRADCRSALPPLLFSLPFQLLHFALKSNTQFGTISLPPSGDVSQIQLDAENNSWFLVEEGTVIIYENLG